LLDEHPKSLQFTQILCCDVSLFSDLYGDLPHEKQPDTSYLLRYSSLTEKHSLEQWEVMLQKLVGGPRELTDHTFGQGRLSSKLPILWGYGSGQEGTNHMWIYDHFMYVELRGYEEKNIP